jgi:hypothetical protein
MPGLHSCFGHDHLDALLDDFTDTPFRAHCLRPRPSPTIQPYDGAGESRVTTVAKTMAEQEEPLQLQDVWYCLQQAQADYKKHYNRRHRAVAFDVGDGVCVCGTAHVSHCLQPQPASSDPATTAPIVSSS